MNMKDYCRVVDRVHADAKCKEAILSDAVMASGQKLPARRPVLGGFSLYVTGAAACLMLLFCGAFFWKLTADSDEFVQMSTPEVIKVSGDSEPEETAASTTAVQSETTTQTTTAQTTATTAATAPVQSGAPMQTTSTVFKTALAEKTETTAQTSSTASAAPKQTAAAVTTTAATVSETVASATTTETTMTTEVTQMTLSESEREQQIIAALQAFAEKARAGAYEDLLSQDYVVRANAQVNSVHSLFDGDTSETDEIIFVPWTFAGELRQFGSVDTDIDTDEGKIEVAIEMAECARMLLFEFERQFVWHSAQGVTELTSYDGLYEGKTVCAWTPLPEDMDAEDEVFSPKKPMYFIVLQDDGRVDVYIV